MNVASSMQQFASELDVRRARVRHLFQCYNERRFDEMLQNYADDIAFTSPTLVDGEAPEATSGIGKAEIRERLHLFHDRFGSLRVDDVFAVSDQVSVIVRDATDQRFTFCIETAFGQLVTRLFVFRTANDHAAPRAA